YIECTAAKVIYHDLLFFLIVKSVCQCSRCRLVDDTFYIKTCDLSGILCSLTLCVIEISGNCDNSLCYFFAKVSFCICFQFLKDHCGNLLRRIFLSVNVYLIICTHLSFDRRDCSVCVCYCLTFCRFSYQTLACLC